MSRRESIITTSTLVIVAVLSRLLPHPANFAPVSATALFCGAYMQRRYSLLALPAIMLTSDYLLLYVDPSRHLFDLSRFYPPWDLYHDTLPFVYLSFGVSMLVGWLLRRERTAANAATAALFCSIQFFLITNAAVWLEGYYARGLSGLWASYESGIPFFKNTLAGDLTYATLFFAAYELVLAQRRQTAAVEPTPDAE